MGITPQPDPNLEQIIQALNRRITALEQATVITLKSPNFDGSLDPPTAGTQGWAIGGPNNEAVFNQLILRDGIIGDDALTNPVQVKVHASTVDYGTVPTSETTQLTGLIPIPDGFTQAAVIASAACGGSIGGGGGALLARVVINGNNGHSEGSSSPSAITVPAQHAVSLTGLVGGANITILANAWANASGWTGGNAALSALAVFLR